MPIYVFRCDACGEKFDRLQKLSDPDPDSCPNCGRKNTVRRQVTAPAFRLAGSGWYETDFKSEKEKKHNLAGHDEPPSKKAPDGAQPANKAESGAKGDAAAKPPAPATPPPATKGRAGKAAAD